MRALSAQVVVILAVVSLAALVALDVVFLFWAHDRYAAEQKLVRRAALAEVLAALEEAAPLEPILVRVAAAHGVVLTIVGQSDARVSTAGDAPPLPPLPPASTTVVSGLYEHDVAPLARGTWRYAIATTRRTAALEATYRTAGWSFAVLAAAGLLTAALGALFLRRVVLRPLARMTELVHNQELGALASYAQSEAASDLRVLGRAIIAMNQTIAEDKARIVAQLDELRRKNREIAEAQHQLLRAERLAVVGQLAAGLAHEVGNPLTVVSGFVEILKAGGVGDREGREALERMGRELERIQRTLRNLLDFSRSPQVPAPGPGDLTEALAHVRTLLAPQSRLRGVTLELPEDALPLVNGVATDALTQLVLNLVLNAIDAVGKSGRIRVTVEQDDEAPKPAILLCVDDSGAGVPADLRARIFEPFFTTKPAGSGTGLGLAVCERIAIAAGGEITVGDSPLGGARFTVTLPRAVSPSPREDGARGDRL